MARLQCNQALSLLVGLILVWALPTLAQEPPPGLYDRPTLILDPGMHTAPIWSVDIDATGRYAATGSEDKTARVWSLKDGRLVRTIRAPAGSGHVGKVYKVAISPDGNLIAASGWTTPLERPQHIYLFERATGNMARRIDGLPDTVTYLTFSPDGRYLAATFGGANGLRVYGRKKGWAEVARDTAYGDDSYGADFAKDGRLATTSWDGKVRLYSHTFHLVKEMETTRGQQPYGIAFNLDGSVLAIGYHDTPTVDLLEGHTLAPLPAPDTIGINNGNLMAVAWSANGATLFAGGTYCRCRGDNINPVIAWTAAGAGARLELPAGTNTITSLAALTNGALLVATQDPFLAVLDPTGGKRWIHQPPKADFRNQRYLLAVSSDGQTVDFSYEPLGKSPARFNLTHRTLTLSPASDGLTMMPRQEGLPIRGWKITYAPTLDGQRLQLDPHEMSRSLAIHPDGKRFILGTEWYLRAFDVKGVALWQQAAPGVTWAVNITGDGRLVVAAYGDGTIRWHRMDNGKELLAFFPLVDRKNWVSWTPEGVYAATSGAHGVLRWHVNHGFDAAAEAIPVSDIPEQFRPRVLPLVLQEMDVTTALGIAELGKIRRAVQLRTNSTVPPGTQLHVLAIGVGDYNEAHAKSLRLKFADDDAHDITAALVDTQKDLYADVTWQVLRNEEASKRGIFHALDTLVKDMKQDDVAVVFFSGHGALVDNELYLLPYEVDVRDNSAIKATAIGISALRLELRRLSKRGRVLVLLDACRSGAATADGTDLTVDADWLRVALATTNVSVLTSSSGKENSLEDATWKNGAFTEVFLEALGQKADTDKNGVIGMTELTRYLTAGVPRLVHQIRPKWHQTPDGVLRFQGTIFIAGLR